MKKILLILCIMAISVGVFADGGTTPQFRYEDMTEGQFWVIDEDGISVNTETFPDVEVGTLNFTDATAYNSNWSGNNNSISSYNRR